MVEQDFKDLADAGVKPSARSARLGQDMRRRGDGGLGAKYASEHDPHGRPVDPGSGLIDKDVVLAADTDIIGHVNGGHTALPDDQIVSDASAPSRPEPGSQRQ
jgi:enamidase